MNKKEIQEKLNNLPKPKYLYQRYNGEIRKYEVQDNILINVKNANDIIDTNKQLILGKISENIIDLIEIGDYVNGEQIDFISISKEGKKRPLIRDNIYFFDKYNSIKSIVTKEQFNKVKYEV